MVLSRFARLELRIMEVLWDRGPCSIREIQEALPDGQRVAYTTVQTTVYRLEKKEAICRVKKISNADIFDVLISRDVAQRGLIDELFSFFGEKTQPVLAQLISSGRVTMEDIDEARKILRNTLRKDQTK